MIETLLKNYKQKRNLLLIGVFVVLLFYIFVLYFTFNYHQNTFYKYIDNTLKNSAYAIEYILPKDFHTKAINLESITKEEDNSNIKQLSEYAKHYEIEYLYTMIQKGDKIFFTSSSATDDDFKEGEVTYYFDEYESATDELKNVLKNNKIVYEESTDKWGTFRSVFIPMESQNGNKYILGADIQINYIEEQLYNILLKGFMFSLIFILFSIIIFTLKYKIDKKELKFISIVEEELKVQIENKTLELTSINKKLQNQKDEFETIFRNSKDGIAILDLESYFLNCNDEYLQMTGFTKEELLTKSCIELSDPNDVERAKEIIKEVIDNGYVQNFEKTCVVKDDKKITVNMSLSLLPDKQRIIISAKDITHLKQLEKQTKLASMGEMIGNIAHQWRQPLSVISTGATGIALKIELNKYNTNEIIKICNQINENAQYLSQTIDDFRNFIKGDARPINFNLKNDTDSFIKLVDTTIKQHNIQVILNLEEHIKIKGYPNELIQCFINIFNNSKDAFLEHHTNVEERYIFISQKIIDDHVVISFKDNAGGIPEHIITKIFEPYFTTKHKSQGTGLGLHMTYNLIVNHMKGSIETRNEEYEFNGKTYKGASFIITLPVS